MKYNRRKTKPKPKARVQRAVSDKVKAYVKKAIHVQAENKIASNYKVSNVEITPYQNNLIIFETLTAALSISQGAGQGDRIGNSIRPVKYIISGHVIGINAAPVLLKMVFFRDRITLKAPTDFSNIFQDGNTTAGPTNTPIDMYMPLNKNDYVIHKTRTFQLAFNYSSGASPEVTGAAAANGVHSIQFFKQDLSKWIPKTIKYDDTKLPVTNAGLYMGFLLCALDGSQLVDTDTYAELSYNVQFEYEDN